MSAVKRVKLTAALIEAFAGAFLSPLYDNPVPTPDFHRECWDLYCSDYKYCAVAAPRGHAKSTALTHDYALSVALFREQDYIVIVSATEELAIGHLGDIAKELRENDDIKAEFGVVQLSTDSKTDIIVDFDDGHQCRFVAKGSGQKMRGMKWNGKRPGLIIGDDLEEDEQVENIDRRRKFRKWFYRALLPCLRRGGKFRMHGTILHEDSLLNRVMRPVTAEAKVFETRLYRAHRAFDDFADILWPEAYNEEALKEKRQQYINDGDPSGYSQEYLNDPFDSSEAFLRKDDFLGMTETDRELPCRMYLGCDFAVSRADSANRTSFTVGGEDAGNRLQIRDQHVGRWDTLEWIDLLFSLQLRYSFEAIFVEDGVIWKSVAPMVYKEMLKRRIFMNLVAILPIKDKAVRGRPLQKRHRAGGMLFDKEASWYPGYEAELLRFTGTSDALQDDQFDSTAILAKGLEHAPLVEDEDFLTDEEMTERRLAQQEDLGRSPITGY